ncbi:MAG: N-acetylmuramoyl-L-alanine amidase [Patescibacteria group bacterium]|nr:N-acetylmuramoyl-L-alanine amidase [Patescibacteria group bacterium]
MAEADVNWSVVVALQQKLEDAGATVVITERLSSRRERVKDAIKKCKATELARKCDVLVSVHHNGSSSSTHDGTLVIYNERKDIPLAKALYNALIEGLKLPDEGYLHGGYGMTVYGNMVSAITEGYYITNDSEAEQYLNGTRVAEEVQALFNGLASYFDGEYDFDNGNKGGNGKNK